MSHQPTYDQVQHINHYPKPPPTST